VFGLPGPEDLLQAPIGLRDLVYDQATRGFGGKSMRLSLTSNPTARPLGRHGCPEAAGSGKPMALVEITAV
jgi:hypothetical protein